MFKRKLGRPFGSLNLPKIKELKIKTFRTREQKYNARYFNTPEKIERERLRVRHKGLRRY